jgi:hypothetical protein
MIAGKGDNTILGNRRRLMKASFDLKFDVQSKKSASRPVLSEFPSFHESRVLESAKLYEAVDTKPAGHRQTARGNSEVSFGRYQRPGDAEATVISSFA